MTRRPAPAPATEGQDAAERSVRGREPLSGPDLDYRATRAGKRLPAALQAAMAAAAIEEDALPRAERLTLVLPFPPSVNNMFPTVRTSTGKLVRVKSAAAKKFEKQVRETFDLWACCRGERPPAPPYALTLRVFPPSDGHRHDLTNCFKAPEDALMAAIGGDDVNVVSVVGTKMPPDHWPRIEITLEHADA